MRKLVLPRLNSNYLVFDIISYFKTLEAYLTMRLLCKKSLSLQKQLSNHVEPHKMRYTPKDVVEYKEMNKVFKKLAKLENFDIHIEADIVYDSGKRRGLEKCYFEQPFQYKNLTLLEREVELKKEHHIPEKLRNCYKTNFFINQDLCQIDEKLSKIIESYSRKLIIEKQSLDLNFSLPFKTIKVLRIRFTPLDARVDLDYFPNLEILDFDLYLEDEQKIFIPMKTSSPL